MVSSVNNLLVRPLTTADSKFLPEALYQALYTSPKEVRLPREIIRLPELARYIDGWGERFAPEPQDDVIDQLAELAPREMRRALMTAFGNARLDRRDDVMTQDLPKAGVGKGKIGFMQ